MNEDLLQMKCENKIRYETRNEAAKITRRLRGNLGVYKCKVCSGFHVGHTTRRNRRKKRINL